MTTMKAARLHHVGAAMEIERIPIPQPAANIANRHGGFSNFVINP